MLPTPHELGYYFPAEWEKHAATWLSYPHKEASWPTKLEAIYPYYNAFIKEISKGEKVCINVNSKSMANHITKQLENIEVDINQIQFFLHPTNDAWCRDHGPAFLLNHANTEVPRVIVDWGYNAWGDKYPPYDLDDVIPTKIAKHYNIPLYDNSKIVMEGGSVEFNGNGTLLTTKHCLLNKNRNPHLTQLQIEKYLVHYYGVEQILWLQEGIVGDDTDGHIDDITRFINHDSVVTVIEHSKQDENYAILRKNTKELEKMRLLNGKQLNIIELPMPPPIIFDGQRLPASYANFYVANAAVIVPTFNVPTDDVALQIIEKAFPDRKVIGINSVDIIWGLGSFHCLSQQEPALFV